MNDAFGHLYKGVTRKKGFILGKLGGGVATQIVLVQRSGLPGAGRQQSFAVIVRTIRRRIVFDANLSRFALTMVFARMAWVFG